MIKLFYKKVYLYFYFRIFHLLYHYRLWKIKKVPKINSNKFRTIQNTKLRKIVEFAYNNVLYYRTLFKKTNITPKDIITVEDLAKIPITTQDKNSTVVGV